MNSDENRPTDADQGPLPSSIRRGESPSETALWAGFAPGVVAHLLPLAGPPLLRVVETSGHGETRFAQVGLRRLVGVSVGTPIIAVALASLRPTHRFGLGAALGCGAVWLVFTAICGGGKVFR